ncbi:MAG: serine/threonine-protein phosphatase [Flaviaesturariibacter sp.]|nr:serine/threonine-protein phosphatase [Flaviaesturariibacter sp.]
MAETIFGITDTGRQRQNNEDAFIAEPVLKGAYLAAGVIDGVGGYEGGEVAAEIAKTTLVNYFSVPSGSVLSMLGEALQSANDKILKHKKESGANDKMACVATIALVEKGANKAYYAHVGDTRLYLFRDGSLVKITKDQSFVGFLEDSGRISEVEAMQHPKRNEINKALGFESILANSDYIETGETPFLPGDLLLLCSDGLTDMIDKAAMIAILNGAASLEQKGEALIAAANAKGGKDNITAVLVKNEQKGIKQGRVKPTAAKNTPISKPVEKEERRQPASRSIARKSNRGLLAFFIGLSILSTGAFLWQWLRHKNTTTANSDGIAVSPSSKSEQQLRDSLQTSNGTIFLANTIYGDTISLSYSLQIEGDSVHIKGGGNTVLMGADSLTYDDALVISPSVKYLLLDSLNLQNIFIKVSPDNLTAVHFNKVRFMNAGIQQAQYFDDSLLTGRADSSFQTQRQ